MISNLHPKSLLESKTLNSKTAQTLNLCRGSAAPAPGSLTSTCPVPRQELPELRVGVYGLGHAATNLQPTFGKYGMEEW